MKQVVIISGPTGSGESTITNAIIRRHPNFARLVTATSRQPRLKEKHGKDYYFFSKDKFLSEVEKGNIIEYTYIKNRDSYYGTYKPDLDEKLNRGLTVMVNVDGVGVDYYKRKYKAVAIFIKPGSIEELRGRLKGRDSSITDAELNKRLENAKAEMANEEKYYDYIVYNENGKLEEAIGEVRGILQREGYALDKKPNI